MHAQTVDSLYKIYATREAKLVTLQYLIAETSKYQVIVFGEEHNDPIGHSLQFDSFKMLHEAYGKGIALSMEMFDRDVQQILDEYLAALIKEKNFINDARPWKNYADYKPMIEFAKEHQLKVIAANAPQRYVNRVTRLGLRALNDLDAQAKKWLPALPIDTLDGRYYEKFLQTMGGHSNSGMQLYQSQNLWDASMADAIIAFLKLNPSGKVLHLNGKFHSDEYLGVCQRLKGAGLKTLTISCFSDSSFNHPDYKKLQGLADYIIITDPGVKRTF